MNDLNGKIEAIQFWVNTLRQTQATNPLMLNSAKLTLGQMMNFIQRGIMREYSAYKGMSETYEDLEKQAQFSVSDQRMYFEIHTLH